MTQKFKHIILGITLVLTAFLLISCTGGAESKIDKALEELKIVYAEGDSADKVTKNLTLPATSNKVDITWKSKNSSVITDAGVVTGSISLQEVVLVATATIKEDSKSKEFALKVIPNPEKVLEQGKRQLAIPEIDSATGNVNKNLTMMTSLNVQGSTVTVTWATSDKDIVSTTGVIFRPGFGETAAEATVTATLKFGDVTDTKEFKMNVLAKPFQPKHSGTVKEIYEKAANNDWVEIKSVTVAGVSKDGVFVSDATGTIYIYTKDAPAKDILVGNVYDVEAQYNIYNGSLQMQGSSGADAEAPQFYASNAAKTEVEAIDAEGISKITSMPLPTTAATYVKSDLYTLEGVVQINDKIAGGGNYTVFIIPTTGFEGDMLKSSVMIYYQGDIDIIKGFDGKKIKFDAFLQGYRSDKNVWYVNYVGGAEGIEELPITADENNTITSGALKGSILGNYYDNAQVTLLAENAVSTITWASSHPAIFGTDGKVVVGSEVVEVTLTATITSKQDPSKKLVVDIKTKVGDADTITIDAFNKLANKGVGRIVGIVTSFGPYNSFTVADASGAVAFRIGGKNAVSADLGFKVGDTISVVVAKAEFNGLIQAELVTGGVVTQPKDKVVKPDPTDINAVDLTVDGLKPFMSHLVSMEKLLVTKVVKDDYNNITLEVLREDGHKISIKWDSRLVIKGANIITEIKLNDVINVVGMALNWNNGPILSYGATTEITKADALTNADKLVFAKNAVEFADNLTSESETTLPAKGMFDATITWTVDNTTLVTIADGKAKVAKITDDALVVFTATIKIGEDTTTRDFNVKLSLLTIQGVLDFGKWTEKKGSEFMTEAAALEAFNRAINNKTLIKQVKDITKTYEGNGAGGGDFESKPGVLKMGTTKLDAGFTLVLNKKVTVIKITMRGWVAKDTFTVNGETITPGVDVKQFTFELGEATDTVVFAAAFRALITNIELY